jgi:hypothetical protein
MLWEAGQRRVVYESRLRRAELFQAVRDAILDADIAVGRARPRGPRRIPDYLELDRDPAAPKRGLAQLVADFPTHVSRGDREFDA